MGMDGGDEVNRVNWYVEPSMLFEKNYNNSSQSPTGAFRIGFAPVPSFRRCSRLSGYSVIPLFPNSRNRIGAILLPSWTILNLRFQSGNFTVTFGNEQRQIGVPGLDRLMLSGSAEAFPAFRSPLRQ